MNTTARRSEQSAGVLGYGGLRHSMEPFRCLHKTHRLATFRHRGRKESRRRSLSPGRRQEKAFQLFQGPDSFGPGLCDNHDTLRVRQQAHDVGQRHTSPVRRARSTSRSSARLFSRKSRSSRTGIALVAVCCGMILFFMDSLGGGNLLGDIAAAIAGITFAANIVLSRKQKEGSPVEALLLGHIFTAVIAGGISLFFSAPVVTPKALFAITALGVVQIGLARPSLLLWDQADYRSGKHPDRRHRTDPKSSVGLSGDGRSAGRPFPGRRRRHHNRRHRFFDCICAPSVKGCKIGSMKQSFLSSTILLILITDPLGNIPLFLAALKNVEPSRRKLVILRGVRDRFPHPHRFPALRLGLSRRARPVGRNPQDRRRGHPLHDSLEHGVSRFGGQARGR